MHRCSGMACGCLVLLGLQGGTSRAATAEWTATYDGPDHGCDYVTRSVIHPTNGNLYLAGCSYSADYSRADMATVAYDRSGQQLWAARYSGDAEHSRQYMTGLQLDPATGKVFVAGTSYSTDGNHADSVIVVYDGSGMQLSATQCGAAESEYPYNYLNACAWNPVTRSIVVAGTSYSAAWDRSELFIVACDAAGNRAWSGRHAGAGASTTYVTALVVDAVSGNAYVTGLDYYADSGRSDIVTLAFDTAGNQLWRASYGSPDFPRSSPTALVLNPTTGGVCVVGASGTADGRRSDMVVLAYDAAGHQAWSAQYANPETPIMYPVSALLNPATGALCVAATGYSANWMQTKIVTLAYDASGNSLWTACDGTPENPYNCASSMLLNPTTGNLHITGSSYSADWSRCDMIALTYSSAGTPLWALRSSGTDYLRAYACASALNPADGSIYVSGYAYDANWQSRILTVACDAAGDPLWEQTADGNPMPSGLLLGVGGDVYVVSNTSGNPSDFCAIKYVENANPDADGDGLADAWERRYFGGLAADPTADPDNDGLTNQQECDASTSPMDDDSDNDGLTDGRELQLGTNPTRADSDGDGMPDAWEVDQGLNPLVHDAAEDPDQDGLTNVREYACGANPHNVDTDADGLSDALEAQLGTSPSKADSDDDGMPDAWEVGHGLNPLLNDAGADLDQDGLANLQEFTWGTDPTNPDTDDDGQTDGWEVQQGLDPLVHDAAAVTQDWLRTYDGPEHAYDWAGKVVTDPTSGHVYVAGVSYNAACTRLDMVVVAYDAAGHQLWATACGTPEPSYTSLSACALDPVTGGVCVVGTAWCDNWSRAEMFTVALDAAGNRRWSATYSDPQGARICATAMAVNPVTGSVCITGTEYSVDWMRCEMVTVAYDAAGTQLWATRYGDDNNPRNYPSSVAIDAATGNTYVTGSHYSAMGYRSDLLTVAYDAAGQQLWALCGTGIEDDAGSYSTAVVVSPAGGTVYATGTSISSDWMRQEIVVLAYDAAGNRLWARRHAAPESTCTYAAGLAVNPTTGGICIAGTSYSSDWSRSSIVALAYDTSGTRLWTARYDSPAGPRSYASAFAVRPADGRIGIVGFAYDANWNARMLTVAFDALGHQVWAQSGPQGSYPSGIAMGPDGAAYAVGSIYGASYDFCTIKYTEPADPDPDADHDGLPDAWEIQCFGDLSQGPDGDADHDGLTNLQECRAATHPALADSDGDGMADGWEAHYGLNPTRDDAAEDADGDGASNLTESLESRDPLKGAVPDTTGAVALTVFTVLE